MEDRIKQLSDFINKYGVNFLEDGSKESILKAINENDYGTIFDVINLFDSEFISRSKEIEMFYIFNDYVPKSEKKTTKKIYYKVGYMDNYRHEKNHIPVLKRCICDNVIIPLDFPYNSDEER